VFGLDLMNYGERVGICHTSTRSQQEWHCLPG
jgi:hypothetical protein